MCNIREVIPRFNSDIHYAEWCITRALHTWKHNLPDDKAIGVRAFERDDGGSTVRITLPSGKTYAVALVEENW